MFSAWMLGFLAVMALLVWVAVVVGLPQPLLGLAILALLVLAVGIAAVMAKRQRRLESEARGRPREKNAGRPTAGNEEH